ncbi:kinase-like protein [Amniculicola lignicola CBS 123094]|uniref:Kinase-like protein n=1 Tax=Amniculicola lignicola CBS 123094 TaxID=1392246 RepID=A0A6A5X0W7_9PLEO|nr:kinase-like protein [Amniculicola lignicola CBS 123094]
MEGEGEEEAHGKESNELNPNLTTKKIIPCSETVLESGDILEISPAHTETSSAKRKRAANIDSTAEKKVRIPEFLKDGAFDISESEPNISAGSRVANWEQQYFDPYDPMVDADPFGLAASMSFPTYFPRHDKTTTDALNPDLRALCTEKNVARLPPASYYSVNAEPASDQRTLNVSPSFHNYIFGRDSYNFSPMSACSWGTPMSMMSANTPSSFVSARSTFNSPAYIFHSPFEPIREIVSMTPPPVTRGPIGKLNEDYRQYLENNNILLPQDKEINWSGKGQHLTFVPQEVVPLKVISHLGSSRTATVDKVKCKRIILAKKTMRCSRVFSITDGLREVEHLHKLRHFHIVQLVGSYLQARNFSILMYPAADYHLGTFLEDTAEMVELGPSRDDPSTKLRTMNNSSSEFDRRRIFIFSSLGCLASTVSYIHAHTTKHMDIKPQNILVRRVRPSNSRAVNDGPWRIYLADFGLSKSFEETGHSQTDGPTARTPKYCAPEVYNFEPRGRASDVFSLGCVFLEMLAVYFDIHPQNFADFRRGDDENVESDDSFRSNLDRVSEWIRDRQSQCSFDWQERTLDNVSEMIKKDPADRPTAADVEGYFKSEKLSEHFFSKWCCGQDPEPYVAAEEGDEGA